MTKGSNVVNNNLLFTKVKIIQKIIIFIYASFDNHFKVSTWINIKSRKNKQNIANIELYTL